MSSYQEFTGKSVEDALRQAREAFGVGLDGLDFEILTGGSRGVLGMGAEPARILAASRAELGGATPKREAAAATPLPRPAPRDDDRPARSEGGAPLRYEDSGPRREDRGPRREDRGPRREDRGPRREDRERGPRRDERSRGPRREGSAPHRGDAAHAPRAAGPSGLSASEVAEVTAARGSLAAERAELEASEASPETLAAAKEILEELLGHLGFEVTVEVESGESSRVNVVGAGDEKEALGALIGRKGERLSALQHLVNLMLSKRMGVWTRVLVDVEDYRGRRERQLRDIALRAAARVVETGKMLQLDPMPALERRWVHIALRDHEGVATHSIGEEPDRRIVVVPVEG